MGFPNTLPLRSLDAPTATPVYHTPTVHQPRYSSDLGCRRARSHGLYHSRQALHQATLHPWSLLQPLLSALHYIHISKTAESTHSAKTKTVAPVVIISLAHYIHVTAAPPARRARSHGLYHSYHPTKHYIRGYYIPDAFVTSISPISPL